MVAVPAHPKNRDRAMGQIFRASSGVIVISAIKRVPKAKDAVGFLPLNGRDKEVKPLPRSMQIREDEITHELIIKAKASNVLIPLRTKEKPT